MEYFAAIDVALERSSVCVVDGTGKIISEAKVANGLWRELGDDGLRRAAYRGG